MRDPQGRDGGWKGQQRGGARKHDGLQKYARPVATQETNQLKGYSLDATPSKTAFSNEPGSAIGHEAAAAHKPDRGFANHQPTSKQAVPVRDQSIEKPPKRRRHLPPSEVEKKERKPYQDRRQPPGLQKQFPKFPIVRQGPLEVEDSPQDSQHESVGGDEGALQAAIASSMRKDAELAHLEPAQQPNVAPPDREAASDASVRLQISPQELPGKEVDESVCLHGNAWKRS